METQLAKCELQLVYNIMRNGAFILGKVRAKKKALLLEWTRPTSRLVFVLHISAKPPLQVSKLLKGNMWS
jgi:hypothetical protein